MARLQRPEVDRAVSDAEQARDLVTDGGRGGSVRLPYNAGMSILSRVTLTVIAASVALAGCNREQPPAQPATPAPAPATQAAPAAEAAQPQSSATLPPPAVPLASMPKIDA